MGCYLTKSDARSCSCARTVATGYAWEGSLERSWDEIEEDETGNLKINVSAKKQQRQRCVRSPDISLEPTERTHGMLQLVD